MNTFDMPNTVRLSGGATAARTKTKTIPKTKQN